MPERGADTIIAIAEVMITVPTPVTVGVFHLLTSSTLLILARLFLVGIS